MDAAAGDASARSSCVPTWRPPWRHSCEFRAAVVLSQSVEGLGLQTVAEALGVPVGTVKSRVFRGRRLLAEALGNLETPPTLQVASTMHRFDPELVAALAKRNARGRRRPRGVQAQIAGDPTTLAELAKQQAALAAPHPAPPDPRGSRCARSARSCVLPSPSEARICSLGIPLNPRLCRV